MTFHKLFLVFHHFFLYIPQVHRGAFLILLYNYNLKEIEAENKVSNLTESLGNLDIGSVIGSYIGLLFLCLAFTSISIFSSSLSKNQLNSFIIGVILNLFFFYGFEPGSTETFTITFDDNTSAYQTATNDCATCADLGQIECWDGSCAETDDDCPEVTCADTDLSLIHI